MAPIYFWVLERGWLAADRLENLRTLIDPKWRRNGRRGSAIAAPKRWRRLAGWFYGATESSFEVLDRETIVPKWREVLITLRRLED